MEKKLALILWLLLALGLAACSPDTSPGLATFTAVATLPPPPPAVSPTPFPTAITPLATLTAPAPSPSTTPHLTRPTPTPYTPWPTPTPEASPPTVPPDAPTGTPVTPPPQPTATPVTPPGAVWLSPPAGVRLVSPPSGAPDGPIAGVSALAIGPDGTFIAGTDGNGVLLISPNGSHTWSTAGLPPDASVQGVAAAAGEMAAWLTGGAAYRRRDSGATWEPIPGLGSGVERIYYSPAYASDGLLFAIQSSALLRSADRGASWTTVLPANNCPVNVAFSPNFASDATALAPRCGAVVRSADRGASWIPVPRESPDLGLGNLMNLQVLTGYPDNDHLLAQGNVQGLPMLSDDGGRTWRTAYDPNQAPFTIGSLSIVCAAPDGALYAAGRVYVYASAISLWRSTNGGANWHETAWAASQGGLAFAADGTVWAGTRDGLFSYQNGGWLFRHPGGSRIQLVAPPAFYGELGVGLAGQGVDKYTSRLRLYEKRDGAWQMVWQFTTNRSGWRAFPAPNYPDERLILLLGQDYGGAIWPMALRPDAAEPLAPITSIPSGPSGSMDQYQVSFAADHATSGRIELRHGYSGALYLSDDRGYSWTRPDPADPGACLRNPVSGFGALWFGNPEVRQRLLCPLEDEEAFAGLEQPFERGEFLRLDPLLTPSYEVWTYALLPDGETGGAWGPMPNYEYDAPAPEPPAGLLPPDPIFYSAWFEGSCCRPDPRPAPEVLGWATGGTATLEIARQRFEGGTLIWRGDLDVILLLEQSAGAERYTVFPD